MSKDTCQGCALDEDGYYHGNQEAHSNHPGGCMYDPTSDPDRLLDIPITDDEPKLKRTPEVVDLTVYFYNDDDDVILPLKQENDEKPDPK